MSRKLSEEVSLQELQQMRADGLSNREIAERLDCSYMTIKRYLGAQPKGMRKPRDYYATRVKGVEKPALKVTQAPKTDLILTSRTDMYTGKTMVYTISSGGSEVRIRNRNSEGGIAFYTKDDFENFILELIDLTGVIKGA